MSLKDGRVERANALSVDDYREQFVGDLDQSDVGDCDDDSKQQDQHQHQQHLSISFTSSAALVCQERQVGRAKSDIESCFRLIEASSVDDYRKSSMRWSPAAKRKEMRLPDMRYLLVRVQHRDQNQDQDQDQILEKGERQTAVVEAFASFMITYEDGMEVVYVYEIHIAESLRGRRLGSRMMALIMGVAQRAEMTKVMLTVFVSNLGARNFYDKLGFRLDEYSPPARKLRNGVVKEPDYQILSKLVGSVSSSKKAKN